MQNPFEAIKKAVTRETKPEKRLIRHAREREIIDIALGNLALSEAGQELVDFARENEIQMTVLRGREARDYTSNAKNAYIVAPDSIDIDDPDLTIHLTGAIREAIQEYDPSLRRMGLEKGEQLYTHREGQKFEDKLFWQTIIVYELGKLANKSEFIDSFATMGYYNLIDGYEKDLTSN
jgi:hypothetical protein